MDLNDAYEDVRQFHETFGHKAPNTPTRMTLKERKDRANFIRSECDELEEAETITDQADAFIDIIYFAVGGLVNLCIRPARLWAIVQKANMAKLWPDGKPRHREGDGKVIKPPGWQPPEPELQKEVARQIREADNSAAGIAELLA